MSHKHVEIRIRSLSCLLIWIFARLKAHVLYHYNEPCFSLWYQTYYLRPLHKSHSFIIVVFDAVLNTSSHYLLQAAPHWENPGLTLWALDALVSKTPDHLKLKVLNRLHTNIEWYIIFVLWYWGYIVNWDVPSIWDFSLNPGRFVL